MEAVYSALPDPAKSLFVGQIESINRVQRILDWKEVEFYTMCWRKVARPKEYRFADLGEFRLATLNIDGSGIVYPIIVWCVSGYVFSLESELPMKPLKSEKYPRVEALEIVANLDLLVGSPKP